MERMHEEPGRSLEMRKQHIVGMNNYNLVSKEVGRVRSSEEVG